MTERRDPEQVLAGIPGFSGAKVARQLSDGPTNASYEISAGDTRYLLRIDKPAASRLGLDRAAEEQLYAIIAAAGLGPQPTWFDADAGIFLRPFLPGRSWVRQDLEQAENLQRLAQLLRKLHDLSVPENRFDPLAAARRYADRIGSSEAEALFSRAEQAYNSLPAVIPVLCHNDLVYQNVLESETLTLIDWEYAGAGDACFDLAVVVEHHGLPEHLEQNFLDAYLGRPATSSEQAHLAHQKTFYATLLQLWQLL